jgi:hypothetical protein
MKSLPIFALLSALMLVSAPVRAEEASSYTLRTRISPNDRVSPLQKGVDGTLYQVRYDLVKGREYWTTPYLRHPGYGIQYFYVLDRRGQRLSQTLYVELPNGRFQAATGFGRPQI